MQGIRAIGADLRTVNNPGNLGLVHYALCLEAACPVGPVAI